MSTQKAKFQLFQRLQGLGFTYEEAVSLRRIEMTLQRWAELECGDAQGRCIERNPDKGNRPEMVRTPHTSGAKEHRYPVADREAGALRRLQAILAARNARHPAKGNYVQANDPRAGGPIGFYHQTDPRGCALYLLRPGDIPPDAKVESCYSNGIAVCC